MIEAPFPKNERLRLHALHQLALLDTGPESRFDHITAIAKQLLGMPIVLFSLVDAERQWFKSRQGTHLTESPRCDAFCAHVVYKDAAIVIEDTHEDERFFDNPLVTHNPYIRFYAGFPVHDRDGFPIGTLCVLDTQPRAFSDQQRRLLGELARLIEKEVRLSALNTFRQPDRLGGWLQKMGTILSRRAPAVVISAMIFGLIAWQIGQSFHEENEYQRQEQISALTDRLFSVRGTIETELNSRLHLTQGLAGFVRASRGVTDEASFQQFANDLGYSLTAIRSLQLAPGGVVKHVWPLAENEAAVGHNLLADPNRRFAAEKAIETRSMWISGPFELIQGGSALIGRQPVFIGQNGTANEAFWGFATVLIDFETFLKEVNLSSISTNDMIAIRGKDAMGPEGAIFYGAPSVFERNHIVADVALPAGSWQIAIAAQGLQAPEPFTGGEWLVIGLGSSIAGLLVFGLLRLPKRFVVAVESATAELERNNARFRDSIESLPVGFAVFDINDQLERCNNRYHQLFFPTTDLAPLGSQYEELLNRSMAMGRYHLNEATEAAKEAFIRERLNQHTNPGLNECEYQLSGGIWIREIERQVPEGGTIVCFADITELKTKEAALTSTMYKAEQANQAKSQFLATVSHELRTPMNAVLGLINLVQNSNTLDARNQGYVDTAYQSAQQLLSLLNELLDLSKMEAGKLDLEPCKFNLKKAIENPVNMALVKAQEKGLTVNQEFAEDTNLCVIGDPGRLQQVVINLLGNAIKFTDAGSVSVYLHRAAPQSGKPVFVLGVRDTGIGFDPERAEGLFKPFAQLDGSSSRRHEGTGLGLAICDRLISIMGGRIEADSSPGAGSEFRVFLPLEICEASSQKTLEASHRETSGLAQAESLPAIRVLIAEDSPANQIVFRAMLENTGAAVDIVGNGLEAVDAMTQLDYDVVLMDIYMPEMDGLEATRAIRNMERHKKTPVIALTANAMAGDQERFMEAGMDDYLSKPATKAQLIRVLHKWSNGRAQPNTPNLD